MICPQPFLLSATPEKYRHTYIISTFSEPIHSKGTVQISERVMWSIVSAHLTRPVLGHILITSYGCDKTLLTLERVYGVEKTNGQSLYYFKPHMSHVKLYKINK